MGSERISQFARNGILTGRSPAAPAIMKHNRICSIVRTVIGKSAVPVLPHRYARINPRTSNEDTKARCRWNVSETNPALHIPTDSAWVPGNPEAFPCGNHNQYLHWSLSREKNLDGMKLGLADFDCRPNDLVIIFVIYFRCMDPIEANLPHFNKFQFFY